MDRTYPVATPEFDIISGLLDDLYGDKVGIVDDDRVIEKVSTIGLLGLEASADDELSSESSEPVGEETFAFADEEAERSTSLPSMKGNRQSRKTQRVLDVGAGHHSPTNVRRRLLPVKYISIMPFNFWLVSVCLPCVIFAKAGTASATTSIPRMGCMLNFVRPRRRQGRLITR